MLPHSELPAPGSLVITSQSLFRSTFGLPAAAAAVSPGRVNLIGDHVDYCGGFVLPIAIDRHTVACAGRGEPGWVRAVSAEVAGGTGGTGGAGGAVAVRLGEAPSRITPAWMRYPVGVIAQLAKAGWGIDGVDLAFASNIPVGAGLSSSAALEIATCLVIEELTKRAVPDGLVRARLAQAAEHEYAGVPCGIMDQYAVVFAEPDAALLLDCFACTHRRVPISEQVGLILVDSGVRHDLATDAYGERRRACERSLAEIQRVSSGEPPASLRHVSLEGLQRAIDAGAELSAVEQRRVRHVISECGRTRAAARAFEAGDLMLAGRLMRESHASLRDDFEVSCARVDRIVEFACGLPGVLGARMTGGGFGGCVVVLAQREAIGPVIYGLRDGVLRGELLISVRPSEGARVIRLASS